MAYYLTITSKNKEFKKLDLTTLNEFERTSKFKNQACSLEEIDDCTSKFTDEVSFKKTLYEHGIIELEDITKELSIRRPNDGKLEKVPFGIIYMKEKKNLNFDYLRMQILSMQNDINFLTKLVSRYRNSYCNNINVSIIRSSLNNSNSNNNLYNALNDFIFKEIFLVDYKSGEAKIKYKSLHDLAVFVINYINNKTMKETENLKLDKIRTKKMELELQKQFLTSSNKPKKKVLTKKEIEGQISLFDIYKK